MEILTTVARLLFPFAVDFFRLCVWLVLLMVVFVPLERVFALHPQKVFRLGFVSDLAYYFLSSLLPKLLLILPMAALGWALHFVVPGSLQARAAALPLAMRFAAALVVGEIGFYWGHRWSHEVPFLWRFHAVHHSAQEMDWLVNTRAHPVDMVFTRLCGFIPLYVLGLAQPASHAMDIVSLLVVLTGTLWGFFIHANLNWRFGPLGWFVATPAFHHWHHTYEEPLNRNFSSMLPWVDRIFGTYHMPPEWPSRYGIEAPMPSGLTAQLLEPLLPVQNAAAVRMEQRVEG
jgi:sterol desaturase/sphingolipid hydroxylase (fatty acid hydroxylase superfamily)